MEDSKEEIKEYLINDAKKLISLLERSGGSLGQKSARQMLRWNAHRFSVAKDYLIKSGDIRPGKGKGGSIKLTRPLIEPEASELIEKRVLAHVSPEDNAEEALSDVFNIEDGRWEKDAAIILASILTDSDIATLCAKCPELDELRKIVRNERNRLKGKDYPVGRYTFFSQLIKIHGADLLVQPKIGPSLRSLISKRRKKKEPGRFVSGKNSAINFIKDCELPIELSGEPNDRSRSPYEDIEGHQDIPALADYQLEVANSLRDILTSKNVYRSMVSLPTGAGKTRTAVESIFQWMQVLSPEDDRNNNLVCWLAQTDELCEQAFEEFRDFWKSKNRGRPCRFVRLWGGMVTQDEPAMEEIASAIQTNEYQVVCISSPMTLLNLLNEEKNQSKIDLRDSIISEIDLLLIDEAHHSAAPTYREIIEIFDSQAESISKNQLKVIGLTATPYRRAKTSEESVFALQEIFGNALVFPKNTLEKNGLEVSSRSLLEYLQKRSILAVPVFDKIETGFHFEARGLEDREIAAAIEESRVRHARRDKIREVLSEILSNEPDASIIYFDVSVFEATAMNSILQMNGINSAVVSGSTSEYRRHALISDFRDKKISVICNCEVLTTGFDAPKVTHVVIARPVSSPVLYSQMIGRGLRGPLFGGTSSCKIIDIRDRISVAGHEYLYGGDKFFDEWKLEAPRLIEASNGFKRFFGFGK